MQPDNHTDARGIEDDWAERFCLAWETGVEVLCGLVGIGVGLMVVAGLVALIAAFPVPVAVIIGALIVAGAICRCCGLTYSAKLTARSDGQAQILHDL